MKSCGAILMKQILLTELVSTLHSTCFITTTPQDILYKKYPTGSSVSWEVDSIFSCTFLFIYAQFLCSNIKCHQLQWYYFTITIKYFGITLTASINMYNANCSVEDIISNT